MSLKSLITITLLISSALSSRAQMLQGTISDPGRMPLPGASVYIHELRQGTTANSDGLYKIQLPPGSYTVTFQFLGYKPVTVTVTINDSGMTEDITLEEQLFEIPAVRVSATGTDPAVYIMRKAIGMAPYHQKEVSSYRAEVYIKGGARIDRLPKVIKKQLKVDANSEQITEGKYYFMESVNIITFTSPDKYVQQVVSSRSNTPSEDGQVSPMDYIKASFYQPVVADMAISPLAPNAFSHYNFRFLGSTSQGDYVIDKIQVIPRRRSQQLFEGTMYIVEDQWAIHSLDLTNMNMTGTVRVRQLFTPVEEGIWMPVSHEFSIDISILGVKATAAYSSGVKYMEVIPDKSLAVAAAASQNTAGEPVTTEMTETGKEITDLLSREELSARDMAKLAKLNRENTSDRGDKESLEIRENTTYIIDDDATGKDSVYWNRVRPIPLTEDEKLSAIEITIPDTTRKIRETSTLTITAGAGNRENGKQSSFRKNLSGIITGRRWSLPGKNSLSFNGLMDLKSFSFNTVDGFTAGTGLRLFLKTGEKGQLVFSPSVKYAFGRERMMWDANINLLYDPMHSSSLFLRAGHSSDEFSVSGVNSTVNTVSSLFFRVNWMKLYDRRYISGGFRSEPVNGLNMILSATVQQRLPLENSTDFSFLKPDREYAPNKLPGQYFSNRDEDTTAFNSFIHYNLTLSSRISYTPRQRYRIVNGAKINAGSDFPTFALQLKYGYNFNDTLSAGYGLAGLEVTRRSELGNFSELSWRVKAGVFINSGNMAAQDRHYFNLQRSPVLIDNFEDAFYLLPYYSLSTSTVFTEGHAKFISPTILVKRFPGISRTLIKENLGLGYLWSPQTGWYYEASYSLSGIFLLAEAGVYTGFHNLEFESAGLRLILRLR